MYWIDLGKYINILTDFDPCSSRRVNDVNACGMEINGLENVFADSFTVPPGGADSDTDAESVLGTCRYNTLI